jgi:hypothetical protein
MRKITIKTENGDFKVTPDSRKGQWALHAAYAPNFDGRYKRWTLTHVPTGLSVLRAIPDRKTGRMIMKHMHEYYFICAFDYEMETDKTMLYTWLKENYPKYMF